MLRTLRFQTERHDMDLSPKFDDFQLHNTMKDLGIDFNSWLRLNLSFISDITVILWHYICKWFIWTKVDLFEICRYWNCTHTHRCVLLGASIVTDLTPNQHGSKDDLQAVKEVVPDDDDCSAPCSPTFTGANGFDAGGCWKNHRQNRLDTK